MFIQNILAGCVQHGLCTMFVRSGRARCCTLCEILDCVVFFFCEDISLCTEETRSEEDNPKTCHRQDTCQQLSNHLHHAAVPSPRDQLAPERKSLARCCTTSPRSPSSGTKNCSIANKLVHVPWEEDGRMGISTPSSSTCTNIKPYAPRLDAQEAQAASPTRFPLRSDGQRSPQPVPRHARDCDLLHLETLLKHTLNHLRDFLVTMQHRECRRLLGYTRITNGTSGGHIAINCLAISDEMWFLTAGPVVSIPMILTEFPRGKHCGSFFKNQNSDEVSPIV